LVQVKKRNLCKWRKIKMEKRIKLVEKDGKNVVRLYLKAGKFELVQENGTRKWVHRVSDK